ncbi:hypothetical protein [Metabacillus iocasae]|uniref:Uncharacterized protein n=1 Tax=Priestia iocasae TaxID=2291674 RepID=A0ABS2QVT8_9BACI|nr:hypothetical protein [Metabacillus iocasae]MBM7702856.1 hypothetical protein [Metabacillus iocasae]
MEKRILGLKVRYIQNVYNITFIEEENDFFAIKIKGINRTYNIFYEETWMGQRGLLQEILSVHKMRTTSNEKSLFKKFVLKWGFISNLEKQSMSEFWNEINILALLLSRYSQIMNKDLHSLRKWILIKEVRKEVYEEINGVQYRIENAETLSAKRGARTIVSFSGNIRCGVIETKSSLNDIQQNELASYQLLGFTFLTEVLYDLNIPTLIRPGRININQRNSYTPIQEIKVDPYLEIKDMCSSIYVLLLMLITKKQSVCKSCDAPFTPKRANNIYCSTTCSNYVKKRNYRERKYR